MTPAELQSAAQWILSGVGTIIVAALGYRVSKSKGDTVIADEHSKRQGTTWLELQRDRATSERDGLLDKLMTAERMIERQAGQIALQQQQIEVQARQLSAYVEEKAGTALMISKLNLEVRELRRLIVQHVPELAGKVLSSGFADLD